jgi:hypothetical protein
MPRAFDCPSSLALAVAPVRIPTDASDLGTAAHVALALVVRGEEPDLVSIARSHGVDKDDLEPMVAYGRKTWAEIGHHFPGVMVEASVESDITSGTIDLLSRVAPNELITIGDWKSGRNQRQYRHQMASYAYATRAAFGMPKSGRITAVIVWLRFCEVEVLQFTDADLDAFRSEFLDLRRNIGKAYAPGEHCSGCQRAHECPARDAFLRSAQTSMVSANTDGILPSKLAELYPLAKSLEKMIEAYHTALKLALVDGPLPIGNGKQIELVESHRAIIDVGTARPVLAANGFSAEDIDHATSMAKGKIEAIAGDRAPRGMKGHHQAAIIRALDQAGAITQTSFSKLQQKKIGG